MIRLAKVKATFKFYREPADKFIIWVERVLQAGLRMLPSHHHFMTILVTILVILSTTLRVLTNYLLGNGTALLISIRRSVRLIFISLALKF